MGDDLSKIGACYRAVKEACRGAWASDTTTKAIEELVGLSVKFLRTRCSPVNLNSLVKGKAYQAYRRRDSKSIVSRPANRAYFVRDPRTLHRMWKDWRLGRLTKTEVPSFLYTSALAPCLVMELFDRQNKKSPATCFECFVGHLIARAVGVVPHKRAELPIAKKNVRLTMDFIFDVEGSPSLHVAVKMSTRERVVQAWAHQRLLDSAHGAGKYRGIMVLFAETKLDSRSHEVVEICVPDQWLAYQALLARMAPIYYFDAPERYRQLANEFPDLVDVRPFAHFFIEKAAVLARQMR